MSPALRFLAKTLTPFGRALTLSACVFGLGGALSTAQAQTAADTSPQWLLRAGDAGTADVTALGLRTAPYWTRDWSGWQLTTQPEYEVGLWRDQRVGVAAQSAEHLAGMVTLTALRPMGNGWALYAEAGLGAAYFTAKQVGSRNISSNFQFHEHLGLGLRIGPRTTVGWRYVHYSNAGLKKPNDGLDAHTLNLSVRF